MRALRESLRVDGWRIDALRAAAGDLAASQDDLLVEPLPGGAAIRVAVLDGVTPTAGTPAFAGLDGAAWAAGALRTAWRAGGDLVETAREVGERLRVPGLDDRSQPQACAIACDLAPGEPVRLVRFGDCEAWVREGATWRPALRGAYVTDAARARVLGWIAEHPGASVAELVDAEIELLAPLDSFITAPVGRLADVRPQAATVERFDELLLCSDGLRPDAERIAALDMWLDGLREWERANAVGSEIKPHDDVTLVRVRREQ